jgi:hypothetical protein
MPGTKLLHVARFLFSQSDNANGNIQELLQFGYIPMSPCRQRMERQVVGQLSKAIPDPRKRVSIDGQRSIDVKYCVLKLDNSPMRNIYLKHTNASLPIGRTEFIVFRRTLSPHPLEIKKLL